MCLLIKSGSELQVLPEEASALPLLHNEASELPSLPNGNSKKAHLKRVAWALLSTIMAFSILLFLIYKPLSCFPTLCPYEQQEFKTLSSHQPSIKLTTSIPRCLRCTLEHQVGSSD